MEKKDFITIEAFGSQSDAGVCGPDGCSIVEHKKKDKIKKNETEKKEHQTR